MPSPDSRPKRPTDTRRDRQAVERELIIGGALILLLVGGGLLVALFGLPALLGALPIFGGALLLGALLWLILRLLEWAARGG